MKTILQKLSRATPGLLAAALSLPALFAPFAVSSASDATETWNPNGAGGGSGTWDTGITPDWNSGIVWTDSNDAEFSGTGGTVTIVNPIANSLTFSATGPYLLQSGTLTLTGSAEVIMDSETTISSSINSAVGLIETGADTSRSPASATLEAGTLTSKQGRWPSKAAAQCRIRTARSAGIQGRMARLRLPGPVQFGRIKAAMAATS